VNASGIGVTPSAEAHPRRWELYKGWIFGLLLILIVLSVGAGFWIHFHG
jgi:hypothetical protein